MGKVSQVSDVCGKSETNHKDRNFFNNHLKTHGNKEYNCSQCGKSFSKRTTLQYHLISAHDSSASSIECDCCARKFKRKDELKKHLKEKNFKETCF